jgi:dipeptidyl aminopeptidase/acylaminoacyl peptidase
MRKWEYPGSDIVVGQTLAPGANYKSYIVSYQSDNLKINALMTVPTGQKPETGWPVIIFNHGFIPPAQYRTTERYVAYVDAFARNGYIVFKSDYRGHGSSEGRATGGYGSPDYAIDVLNAVASIKRYKDADPNRIGMWGHSMGGSVTLRAMVVSQDIKAGVIWAGVVASYPDLFSRWRRRPGVTPTPGPGRGWRNDLVIQYGTPEENPEFWASISANSYLSDLTGPIQLHHDTGDHEVPFEFSETLSKQIQAAGKEVEFYAYPGDDHNLANSFGIAMQRSIQFFNKHVKNLPGLLGG